MNAVKKIIYTYWQGWVNRRIHAANPIHLHTRSLFIIPTGFGWLYAFFLLTLFTAAINYQISTIFLMTFLLALLGCISAWEAHNNLKELSIGVTAVEDAIEGKSAYIILSIHAPAFIRYSIKLQTEHQSPVHISTITEQETPIILPLKSLTRGCFQVPHIKISSVYPLGLFRVWSYALFTNSYHIYPKPVRIHIWPKPLVSAQKNHELIGQDEWYDLKKTNSPWAQTNRIAWKLAAKGQGWYIKNMTEPAGDAWCFRRSDSPAQDIETQLRHMSYWLHESEAQHNLYTVELAGSKLALNHGKEHLKHCLQQLARYQ